MEAFGSPNPNFPMKFGSSKCVPPPQLRAKRAMLGIMPAPLSMNATEETTGRVEFTVVSKMT